MILVVVGLVILGSILAMSEASISRVNRVRALALQAEGRRHAARLHQIEAEPTLYLNSIYLAVMFAQNGSAILVAFIAERAFGNTGITLVSIAFTLLYFVVVEALSKTLAVLHSDRVALTLTPFVYALARVLAVPTRTLLWIAGHLLPKSIRKEVSEEDIRSMADVGHAEGAIERRERDLIHSIFRFGDTVVREVMTPRPDIVSLEATTSLDQALEAFAQSGYSRLPIRDQRLDEILGFVHVKDVLRVTQQPSPPASVREIATPIRFVPESRRTSELLKEMQRERHHIAMVMDEYGVVSGLVTMEDLLEEIVGEIEDESDQEEPTLVEVAPGRWRVDGRLAVTSLNASIGAAFPNARWDTVGGLVTGLIGRLPSRGEQIESVGFRLTVEKAQGRRVRTVGVERIPVPEEASAHEAMAPSQQRII